MNKSLITNIIAILLIITGYFSPLYSFEIKTMGLYAFSGAVTNWLAIHMLFEKVPGLYGSGVIVKRFEDFKVGIRELIMTQFFTSENINKFLASGASSIAIDPEMVFIKLKEAVLESQFGSMLSMFGGEAALEPLRPKVAEKLNEILAEVGNSEGSTLPKDIEVILETRLNELTPQMVKDIIQNMIREHLGWLVVWGGIFGAIIGLLSTFL